jgi:hypothetical protein
MKRNPKIAILATFALVAFSILGTTMIGAQDQNQQSPASIPPAQTQPAAQPVWTADQLDNLVAPIALYPDPLLSQMLVASTYPLEVVEANQWLQRNKNLQGQALIDAAKQQPWDPSIQTLVTVPDALATLNEDIQWTTDLGDAFLAQESDVMNAVQRMRLQAEANGHLATTKQQKVVNETRDGQQVVVIEPAYPDVIYVPVYDPFYVWGPPLYGYYPALYYPSYGFGFSVGYDVGYYFTGWGGWGLWGWSPNWFGHTIFVNTYFFNHYGFRHHWRGGDHSRLVWVHNPAHRSGVPYRSPQVAARFSGNSAAFRNSNRIMAGRNGSEMRFANRPENRFARRTPNQGSRNAMHPARRFQNHARERYQSAPRNQIASNQNRVMPQVQRQYRSEPQRYSEGPRVVPFGGQRQFQYRAPQVQRYQSAPQQMYRAPQQFRSAPQTFRAPQVQQFRSMQQPRFQASPQFRSAHQMSAPRFGGGGGFSRGGRGR